MNGQLDHYGVGYVKLRGRNTIQFSCWRHGSISPPFCCSAPKSSRTKQAFTMAVRSAQLKIVSK
jgi:hypothetical protein